MAVCIIVSRWLQPLFPHRPLWATPFAKEFGQQRITASPEPIQRPARILLILFLIGLVLRLVTTFHPHLNVTVVAPAISWVIGVPKSKNPFDIEIRPYSLLSLQLIDQKPLLLAYLQLCLALSCLC